MTDEEKAAQRWWLCMSDDQMLEVMVNAYREHIKHQTERKELGFKFDIGE